MTDNDADELGSKKGLALCEQFIRDIREMKQEQNDMEKVEILGPAGEDPYIQEHARQYLARQRAVADLLVKRLLIDGMEHRIQIEDIEALCALEKTPAGRSPEFMRKVMIELMLSLRRG